MRDQILTGRPAKMHIFSNAWDAVITILGIIFTSIATCTFWAGIKSKQLDTMSDNIAKLTEEVGSLRTSNNQVLQVVAAMSGQTVDGFKWRIKNQGE